MKLHLSDTSPLFALIEYHVEQHSPHFSADFIQIYCSDNNRIEQLSYAIGMSDFVKKVFQKQPHFFAECLQKPLQLPSQSFYTQQLQQVFDEIESEEQFYKALRQYRHQEMARLSICQSLNLASVEQIFVRLSQLAESLIIFARNWLYEKACQEMGTPLDERGKPQQLYILGMGKLGGFELNFSSDIDLIFTYPSNGETVGARRSVDHQKFFTRLGQRLINALDQLTEDGFVYRTDMRLRPFGDSCALALSFNAMESYYQEQGRDWERYAMIKGRILGLDPEDQHAKHLQQLLRPFVYRRYIDFSVIQSLREMKGKISREIRRRGLANNIKLGPGGIREIEFIVQVFQLMRGGREITLQQQQLLKLLPELSCLSLISTEQSEQLRQAYLFLRRVENSLQAIDDKQTQELPANPIDQQRLIAACAEFTQLNAQQQVININYPIKDWESFSSQLQYHQNNVQHIFNQLIGDENDKDPIEENVWQDFLDIDQEELTELLRENQIDEQHFEVISDKLNSFRYELQHKSIGPRGREALNKLLPQLFSQIFAHADYLTLLPRMLNIVEKILTRTTYLELLLENPQVLTQLVALCSKSDMIAEQVAKHPILLDELLDQKNLYNPISFEQYPSELHQYLLRLPQDDEEQFINGLRQFKQATLLHIAAADILGVLPVMKVSDHLTYLAEAIINSVVELAWQQVTARFGVPPHLEPNEKGFLIIGYGKLGGIELGYKSDLDLVFLYDGVQGQTTGGKKSVDNFQFYLRLAQKIVSIFSMNTSAGVLYDVDLRLRPAGEAGLICNSISAFEQYQANEAWTWEHQALVRSRVIYGDQQLQNHFNHIRQSILARPKNIAQLKIDVIEMRNKMYQSQQSSDPHKFNIKKDMGGIIDIEFIAQYLVLAYSPNNPDLAYWSDNVRIFEVMATNNVISLEQAEQLKGCYTDLRNHIHHLNLIGLNSEVNADEFIKVRSIIQKIWSDIFNK
ncbi:bifunctional [glutamate--ammonia ligase]-adenylyl-L-tyrosine phosphorylase/[glutamate--ammonia-ligase] adenylyltransferase [Pasteurellaceae bacterium 22721_9_1]